MSVLVLTPGTIGEIKSAVAEARRNVVPWAALQHVAVATPSNALMLSDRRPGTHRRPASIAVELGPRIVAAISFEEQPAGVIRHLSVSSGRPGQSRLVHPIAFAELARLFGFSETAVRILEGRKKAGPFSGRIWLEEYKPNFFALNIAELDTPAPKGTMQ